MKKIEALMQQIQQIADPAQKGELFAQHLDALREQMRLVRRQHSDMKMSMKEGGMRGRGMMMHKKMDLRMEILELERLLQQMIEREAVEASIEQR
jgi:hypothetical protein